MAGFFDKGKYQITNGKLEKMKKEASNANIPDGVISVGESVFSLSEKLKSVTFPNSVQKIEKAAFLGAKKLTSVTFPDGLEEIEEKAFSSCPELSSVTFNEGLCKIGNNAFAHCKKLKSLEFPSSLRKIETAAFMGLSDLSSVKLNDGIYWIGDSAFYDAPIKEITIPTSVKYIGNKAFNTRNMTVNYKGSEEQWNQIQKIFIQAKLIVPDLDKVWYGSFCPSIADEPEGFVEFHGTEELWNSIDNKSVIADIMNMEEERQIKNFKYNATEIRYHVWIFTLPEGAKINFNYNEK